MLRTLASKLHRYLGLVAGLLLVPIGLTGSVLVFHEEIDAVLYPELVRVEPQGVPVSLDAAMDAVRAAFPGHEPARLDLARAPHETHEVTMHGDGLTVYVDPYRGVVLGALGPTESVTGLLFEIHTKLLPGALSETVVGVLGLLLLVLGLTGLVLWWRGRRRIRQGLTVRWRAARPRVNYDLHNVLGFYVVLPLLALAFTGAGLVFYAAFSDAVHALSGTPKPAPPPRSTPVAVFTAPSLDDLRTRAQAAFPTAAVARIDFPSGPEGAFRVRLRLPDDVHPVGMSMVYLDRYSGAVLQADNALTVPAATRFGHWFYPVHIGSFGGLGVRLLWVVVGLAPAVLFVTGFFIWRKPRRMPRSARPAAAVPARPARVDAARPASRQPHTSERA